MDCKQIKLWLSYYLLDELDEPTRSSVEAHLETCAGCRQTLEDLKYYQSVLQQVDKITSPEDLREKILGQMSREKSKLHVAACLLVLMMVKLKEVYYPYLRIFIQSHYIFFFIALQCNLCFSFHCNANIYI